MKQETSKKLDKLRNETADTLGKIGKSMKKEEGQQEKKNNILCCNKKRSNPKPLGALKGDLMAVSAFSRFESAEAKRRSRSAGTLRFGKIRILGQPPKALPFYC